MRLGHAFFVGAALSAIAAFIWLRSSFRLERSWQRVQRLVDESGHNRDAADLAHFAFRKELHTGLLYLILSGCFLLAGLARSLDAADLPFLLLAIPIGGTFVAGRRFLRQAEKLEERSLLEKRAEEVLEQEATAPRAWAGRLAPAEIPAMPGFEVGHVYEAGTGLMAGDFYDIYRTGGSRLAVVVGDVTGHGIEPSITAFQVKYLLRVFLRQYRDPAQALEQLNIAMAGEGSPEEFVSLVVAVLDPDMSTLRYASAGHPSALFWHDNELRALAATGPILMLEGTSAYSSRELTMEPSDLLLVYTDGLIEARAGSQLFGEDRVAQYVRRDPGQDASVLCKALLAAARDFAAAPLQDDVAILAVRRV